jgi:hypothetical protein
MFFFDISPELWYLIHHAAVDVPTEASPLVSFLSRLELEADVRMSLLEGEMDKYMGEDVVTLDEEVGRLEKERVCLENQRDDSRLPIVLNLLKTLESWRVSLG